MDDSAKAKNYLQSQIEQRACLVVEPILEVFNAESLFQKYSLDLKKTNEYGKQASFVCITLEASQNPLVRFAVSFCLVLPEKYRNKYLIVPISTTEKTDSSSNYLEPITKRMCHNIFTLGCERASDYAGAGKVNTIRLSNTTHLQYSALLKWLKTSSRDMCQVKT